MWLDCVYQAVLKRRRLAVGIFIAAAVLCGIASFGVEVKYQLADYLPESALSTKGIAVMNEAFPEPQPTLYVYVPEVTVTQALAMKEKLRAIEGVASVLWLDDAAELGQPIETLDQALVETYYHNGAALFSVASSGAVSESELTASIREAAGEKAALAGELAALAFMQDAMRSEIGIVAAFLLPVILIILLLTTHAWLDPILFLAAIGVSILLNMGTNLFFSDISFITAGVAPILQMAVSMDYAIFLLDSFTRKRKEGMESVAAMTYAMKHSSPAIIASALTTMIGFLALTAMRFRIGPDMGIVLAKGIVFSLLSVMLFLPCLILCMEKALERTAHKAFLPSFRGMAGGVHKMRAVSILVLAALVIPCYLGQMRSDFLYGTVNDDPDTQIGADRLVIEKDFSLYSQMALLVPSGNAGREEKLISALKELPETAAVISYTEAVGASIPPEFVGEAVTKQFYGGGYSRIALQLTMAEEGEAAFAVVERVREAATALYGEDYHLVGTAVSNYDMRATVTADSPVVTAVSIAAIGLVLLLTFRSLSIPLILIFVIESAIWINMSLAYFMGSPLHYIGYLIVSAVQLGATVDYAILLTQHYRENRAEMPKREAVLKTVGEHALPVLTSASILTAAGVLLGMLSSNEIVSQLGILLGRGAAISGVLVLTALPALLYYLDGFIAVTTLRYKRYAEHKEYKEEIDDESKKQ